MQYAQSPGSLGAQRLGDARNSEVEEENGKEQPKWQCLTFPKEPVSTDVGGAEFTVRRETPAPHIV